MCICLSHLYLLYLMCICCILCVFVVLMCICCTLMCICCTYVYLLCSYVYFLYYVCIAILTLDAGLLARGLSGRSCDRPPRHRFFSVSLCLQANAQMVPQFPSCYYMPLV